MIGSGRAATRRRGAARPVLVAILVSVSLAAARPGRAPGSPSTAAILSAGVIRASDVPSGWVSAPPRGTGSEFTGRSACHTINTAEASATRHAARRLSRQFGDPQAAGTTVADDTVYAFPSVAAASRYVAAYQAASAAPCLQSVLARAVGSAGTATVEPLTALLRGLGDANAGYEGTIEGAGQQGQRVALVADLVTVQVGRAAATFEFLNANQPIPEGPGIVDTVVARLEAARSAPRRRKSD